MAEKVLVAMSGGVDSAVAALLLKNAGYDVYGMTLRLWCADSLPLGEAQNELDAKSICERLDIPFYVCDYSREFCDTVIADFISAYENGETPNPCVVCNRYVKFELMLREAERLGIDKVATGHYSKIESSDGRYIIKKGADLSKDQSYMLVKLTQDQLSRLLFPLGELTKAQIREIAEQNGLSVAHKKDSRDICFIPDGDYVAFIEGQTQKVYPKGEFTDIFGNVLGEHQGLIRYTTGQRKGLGIALGAPMYVISKDVEGNRVVLGTNEQLFGSECVVTDVNGIAQDAFDAPMRAEVKVRYSHTVSPAWIYPCEDGVRVEFDTPQRAITKGQTAAFYSGDVLLGGGKIK